MPSFREMSGAGAEKYVIQLQCWESGHETNRSSLLFGFSSCRAKAGIEVPKLKTLTVSAGVIRPMGTEARGSV